MSFYFTCTDCGSRVSAPWLKVFALAEEHQEAHSHVVGIRSTSEDSGVYIQNGQGEWGLV